MQVEIYNDFILKSLIKKDKLTQEMNKVEETNARIIKENEENQAEFQALLTKLKREDEKVRPELVRESDKIEKGEFDVVSRVLLSKDKKRVYIEVADRLEEFKAQFRAEQKKQNEEKNNSGDTTQGKGKSNKDTTEPLPLVATSGDGVR